MFSQQPRSVQIAQRRPGTQGAVVAGNSWVERAAIVRHADELTRRELTLVCHGRVALHSRIRTQHGLGIVMRNGLFTPSED